MEAVDESIPDPVRDKDKPFLMPIEDVFTITGRGTVVTGRAERGTLKINSEVEIVGIRPTQKTTVTGIEMFHKQLDEAWAGENCGLLLRGTKREDVERGQVVVAPGSVTPHTNFEGTAYILSKEEGGRHNPFYANYRPQFYFRTTDVTGVITLPEGTEMVMPGDTTDMTVELIQPIAMEEGLGFAIREGGRTVGAGTVTKIVKYALRAPRGCGTDRGRAFGPGPFVVACAGSGRRRMSRARPLRRRLRGVGTASDVAGPAPFVVPCAGHPGVSTSTWLRTCCARFFLRGRRVYAGTDGRISATREIHRAARDPSASGRGVGAVVLHHGWPAVAPGRLHGRRRLLRRLGLPHHRAPAPRRRAARGSVSLRDFYVRRARRILPAAWSRSSPLGR